MTSEESLRDLAETICCVPGTLREIADELETLRKRDAALTALEDGGVAHWERYEDSLEDAGL
jgi:hypothetical protein